MIHTRVLHTDGACRTDVAPENLHPFVEDQRNVFWIDLESPTLDELGLVGGLLGWQHLTIEDVAKQGQRAKLETFDTYTYLVMHQLSYDGAPARLTSAEVDFVIGANYVATVHYVPVPSIAQALDIAHQLAATLGRGRDYLLYALADELVDSYFPVLDAMHEAVDDLEDEIVANPAQSLMSRIFEMKRDAVSLRKIISPQLEVFTRLTAPGFGIISEEHVI